MKASILITVVLCFTAKLAFPCSAIVLKHNDQILLAKNFDWTLHDGMIIKNLRGTSKTAYFTHTGKQATWTSKYGSITFNKNGKEMPYGGMNEQGLAIEMLWLEFTSYNINASLPYVNELEWIQYQLDQYESVDDVLAHLNDLKIYPIKGKIHYILTDATGHSVVIEYLNGKPIVYAKEANTCQAITNYSVVQSEPYKVEVKGMQKDNTSHAYRFFQLEQQILTLNGKQELQEAFAFDILQKVTIPKGDFKTMWSIVYNIHQRSISFFTDTHSSIKTINLSAMDFDSGLSYLTLNQDKLIDLSNALEPLTEQVNQTYVTSSLTHLGLDETVTKDISQHQFRQVINQPGVYADQYFHLEIVVPLPEEKQLGFLAVMDSKEAFERREAVTGGYLYGNIAKGTLYVHIYGLKSGRYAMLAFIDDIKNRKLDFDKEGKPLEKYATFSAKEFLSKNEITFENTSADFSRANSRYTVKWIE